MVQGDTSSVITIVDDDPSVRKALGRLCRSHGYRVQLFESSECFLASDSDSCQNLLILDVHLPGKSGLELQAELVARDCACPILFITAFDNEKARQQAIDAGAIGFLGKPLDSAHVLQLIEQALDS